MKEKSKNPSEIEEIIIFVKHALSGDEANFVFMLHSKHDYSKSACHNLYNVQVYICICSKNCTNKLQNYPPDLRNGGWCQFLQS